MPLAPIQPVGDVGSIGPASTIEVAQAGLHPSSPANAAAFAKSVDAVQQPLEMQAPAPAQGDSLAGHFADRAQALSLQFNAVEKAQTAPPAAADGGPIDIAKSMDSAVSGMQSAYLFAIETAMASRGSTEMTKIFNTLLKGQ